MSVSPNESAPASIRYIPSSAVNARGAGAWRWVVPGIGLAVIGSLYFGRVVGQFMPQTPLPVMATSTGRVEVTERSGRTVRLSELHGKVTVMACLYTVCPHGCAAVVAAMQKLNALHRLRTDFHQVSLAVAPDRDTAAFLKAYAEGVGVKPDDPWWFITGDQQRIWDFMTKELQLETPKPIPEEKRLNPLDFFEHDLRLVLLDRAGRVRGYYSVFHPQSEIAQLMNEKLERDVQRLLDEPAL
jgi:cytochrome oxidase Cu insertion factor (SCO1/SenC/PrrC family)